MSKKMGKILVPLCMFLGVFGLWYMEAQNSPKESTPTAHSQNTTDSSALAVSHINLEELKKQQLPMIIDFGADACIPCKEMAPVLIKLHADMKDKAIIKFVDVWKSPDAAQGFPVQVIPTQILILADGTPYVPKNVKDIEFILYKDKETQEHVFTAHQGGLTEAQMLSILADMENK